MAVSRRTLFKGLFGAAGVAGLTILAKQVDRAPKLLLRSDNDEEYDAWLKGDRKHYWQGTGPMEQLAAKTSGLRADYRTYLLSRTDLGCRVLYAEMLGIPKNMWGSLPFEARVSRTRQFRNDLANLEFPPIEEMMSGRARLEPRNRLFYAADGSLAASDVYVPDTRKAGARLWTDPANGWNGKTSDRHAELVH